jgi:hypothetical protein
MGRQAGTHAVLKFALYSFLWHLHVLFAVDADQLHLVLLDADLLLSLARFLDLRPQQRQQQPRTHEHPHHRIVAQLYESTAKQ